jgi:spore germination protein GerM
MTKKIIFFIVLLLFVIIGCLAFVIIEKEKTPETAIFFVYFHNDKLDPEISCDKVFPTQRTVLKTQTPAEDSVNFLLAGPTESEKDAGYYSVINPGVVLNGISIVNGTAKVDFNQELEVFGGSCLVLTVRSEIIQTLKQFATVENVLISINGQSEEILQP